MAFKMAGFSAFTKNDDKVKREDLDKEGKEIWDNHRKNKTNWKKFFNDDIHLSTAKKRAINQQWQLLDNGEITQEQYDEVEKEINAYTDY